MTVEGQSISYRRVTRSTAHFQQPLFNRSDVFDIDDVVHVNWFEICNYDDVAGTYQVSHQDEQHSSGSVGDSSLTQDMTDNDFSHSDVSKGSVFHKEKLIGWQQVEFDQDVENLALMKIGRRRPLPRKTSLDKEEVSVEDEAEEDIFNNLELQAIDCALYNGNIMGFIARLNRVALKVKNYRSGQGKKLGENTTPNKTTNNIHMTLYSSPSYQKIRNVELYQKDQRDLYFSTNMHRNIPEVVAFLEKLGPKNVTFDSEWLSMVRDLIRFRSKHGHYDMLYRSRYKSIPKYCKLTSWCRMQRDEFHRFQIGLSSKLTMCHLKYLEGKGISFSRGALWEDCFIRLLRFKEEFGHMIVPIHYQEEGVSLNQWVGTQRRQIREYDPDNTSDIIKYRTKLLISIGLEASVLKRQTPTSFAVKSNVADHRIVKKVSQPLYLSHTNFLTRITRTAEKIKLQRLTKRVKNTEKKAPTFEDDGSGVRLSKRNLRPSQHLVKLDGHVNTSINNREFGIQLFNLIKMKRNRRRNSNILMGETYNLRTSLPITSTNWNGCCVRKSHRDIENMFEYTDDCHTAFTRRTIRAAAKVKLRRYICRVRRLANKIETKQSIYRFDKRSYDEALGMCHHSELQCFKKC